MRPWPRTSSGTACTASTAFLRMLVIACDSSRVSKAALTPLAALAHRERDVRMRHPHHEQVLLGDLGQSLRAIAGLGIRANDENSSTIRLMSST